MKVLLSHCVAVARASARFAESWARLHGVQPPHSPIERMIDRADGYAAEVEALFVSQVAELILAHTGGQGE